MKRVLVLFMIMVLPLAGRTVEVRAEIPSVRISTLISEYGDNDGFEVIRLGSLTTMLAKSMINTANLSDMGTEMAIVGKMIRGIKKIAVVDYEDAEPSIRAEFSSKVAGALKTAEVIMEARDGGSVVRMYGKVSDDGSQLQDLVLFCPEDCALIMLKGTLPTDMIAQLATM